MGSLLPPVSGIRVSTAITECCPDLTNEIGALIKELKTVGIANPSLNGPFQFVITKQRDALVLTTNSHGKEPVVLNLKDLGIQEEAEQYRVLVAAYMKSLSKSNGHAAKNTGKYPTKDYTAADVSYRCDYRLKAYANSGGNALAALLKPIDFPESLAVPLFKLISVITACNVVPVAPSRANIPCNRPFVRSPALQNHAI